MKEASGSTGSPARFLGGQWSTHSVPLNPVVDGAVCLLLLSLLPPAGGTGDESHLSILFPGPGRPCLFISISSICGTAAVGWGCRCCWHRLVRAFSWQRYSWQAGERAAHTWLINTNNKTANQELCWSGHKNEAFENALLKDKLVLGAHKACSSTPYCSILTLLTVCLLKDTNTGFVV